MRVAGGKIKGHPLKVPKVRDIRPTQESIRLAIFNILGDFVEGKDGHRNQHEGGGNTKAQAFQH